NSPDYKLIAIRRRVETRAEPPLLGGTAGLADVLWGAAFEESRKSPAFGTRLEPGRTRREDRHLAAERLCDRKWEVRSLAPCRLPHRRAFRNENRRDFREGRELLAPSGPLRVPAIHGTPIGCGGTSMHDGVRAAHSD